ncbi:MAG: hypothetical protein GY835_04525 [bacterium]|nr:hypothetical protein [bacterium]
MEHDTPDGIARITSKSTVPLMLVLMIPLLLVGCGGATLPSIWLEGEAPVIDGTLDRTEAHDEWRDSLHLLESEHMHVGLLNDEDALYLCLATRSRTNQIQMLKQGFTLWLDAAGGGEKAFGLRFPGGAQRSSPPGLNRKQGRKTTQRELPHLADLMVNQETNPMEVDFMIAEGVHQRLTLSEVEGLELALGADKGVLYYELRLPFASLGDTAYALAAAPGDLVGVGFETEAMDPPAVGSEQSRPDRGMGGGRGGGMGGGRGGGKGGGRSEMPSMPEPIDFWGKIQLASPAGEVVNRD